MICLATEKKTLPPPGDMISEDLGAISQHNLKTSNEMTHPTQEWTHNASDTESSSN
jgi:hypothetical protein